MELFKNLIKSVLDVMGLILTSLNDLLTEINSLVNTVTEATINSNFVVNKTLGAVRFIIGDTIYISMYLAIILSLLYTIYILVHGIIKTINEARLNVFKIFFK